MNAVELGISTGYMKELKPFDSHRHNDIELNFLMSGQLIYEFAGKQIPLCTNRLALFWAAIPHGLVSTTPDTNLYWITVPLSYFMNWDLPNSVVKHVLQGAFIQDSSDQFIQLDQYWFRQWHQDITGNNKTHNKTVLLEIEARLRRLTLGLSTENNQQSFQRDCQMNSRGLHTAQQIAQFIAQHYVEPINCRVIAQELGIHPGYASRIFANTYNMGIIEYLTQYRVAAAQKLLLTTDLQVTHIAFEVGFGSISRFYVAFKSLCELSPQNYRLTLTQSRPIG